MMTRTRLIQTAVSLIALLVIGGCSDGVGPAEDVASGLRFQLEVTPSSVQLEETVLVTLRLENLRHEPVEMTSSCTAVALIKTFRGGERVDLKGTTWGCGDAFTQYTIGARETLSQSYEIRAARSDEGALGKGTYDLHVEFMVPLPPLETQFTIE